MHIYGSLGAGNKSDILACIKAPTARVYAARQPLLLVVAMAAIVHMVRPTRAVTLAEYYNM